jgi:hypothetical protein
MLDAVKEVVKLWYVSLMKEFWVVKCRSDVYDVKCIHEGCPCIVHAGKGRWKTHWTCSIIMEHNCSSEAVAKYHRNMTSTFVAQEMYGLIIDNLAYEHKMMIRCIQWTYCYTT